MKAFTIAVLAGLFSLLVSIDGMATTQDGGTPDGTATTAFESDC
jgi:hypothetical protein